MPWRNREYSYNSTLSLTSALDGLGINATLRQIYLRERLGIHLIGTGWPQEQVWMSASKFASTGILSPDSPIRAVPYTGLQNLDLPKCKSYQTPKNTIGISCNILRLRLKPCVKPHSNYILPDSEKNTSYYLKKLRDWCMSGVHNFSKYVKATSKF